MNRNFHMTVGIVGSGKSTFVKELQVKTNATVVCPDDIRAELSGDAADQSKNGYIFTKLVPDRIKAGLAKGDVIYDATNYNRKNRRDVCILAKSLGAKVIAHVFTTPHDECRRRNAGRSRVVPDFVIDRQIQGYEAPDINIEKIDEIQFVAYKKYDGPNDPPSYVNPYTSEEELLKAYQRMSQVNAFEPYKYDEDRKPS